MTKQEEIEDKIRGEYDEILPQLRKIESLLVSTVRWKLK